MKRIFLLNLLACIFAVGCQVGDNTDNTINTDTKGVVLGISLEQTRTSLGAKDGDRYPVYWSEGDKIVVNGVLSDVFHLSSITFHADASFQDKRQT